ncbi:MAG TPA: acetylxylan esterase [Spirochaetia bacterium]|nr:acetylxylan esterase [Spirochaetia bacterium]
MRLADLPLEKLPSYGGTNPRPEDFDDYWKRGLEELAGTNPDVKLARNEFESSFCECFDLYFTGVRGARIHAKYLRPTGVTEPHPAILEFHGYSGSAGDWSTKLPWAAEGFSVLSMDCRGQGGLSEDNGGVKGTTLRGHIIRGLDDQPDNLLFRHIFLDTAQLARIAMEMPEVDGSRIGATGGSQGGGLTIACGALEPRVKLLAPVFPFLSDYKRVWDLEKTQRAYEEIGDYFRRFDPQHKREREIFTRLGYIDIQNLAPRIRGEVMLAVGLMDDVCPPSTQFAAYNKITSEKSVEIYPDFTHEALPGHTDRIFQFMRRL